MTEPNRFYITTAIDYPNSDPHIGHAYEKIVTDFYARSYRIRDVRTRFLIGLDEHGQKIQEAAGRAGQSPQQFLDEKAAVFRRVYAQLEISNDDFIRTSEARHHAFVTDLYRRVEARGDIYKGIYQADYCVACERPYTKSELVDGKCPVHDVPAVGVSEDSYFFRLGKYREALIAHIEAHPEFIWPDERRNEILSRLGDELLDLSISRSSFNWGIPLPGDPSHVLYVWFDALSNYASALTAPDDLLDTFWPADTHVIGKDIIWFHTVIWPAMLMAAGYALPRQVYVHGMILDREGRKMSKHLGNGVDPADVMKDYSPDILRFYLLRSFSSGLDGKFSLDDLEDKYQSELGNDLGNLVMRIAKLVVSRRGGTLTASESPMDLDAQSTIRDYFRHVDAREHHRSVEVLWAYVRKTNAYINEKQPWKIPGDADLDRVLVSVLEAMRVIAHLASPIMPATASAIADQLGFPIASVESLATRYPSYRVSERPPLFPRRARVR